MTTKTMMTMFVLTTTIAGLGCGGSSPPVRSNAPVAAPTPTSPPPASNATWTRARLEEMQNMVMRAYPAPFERTFASLTEQYGQPMASSENMHKWFARDGETCVMFFVTRANDGGHAAAGIHETDATDCH